MKDINIDLIYRIDDIDVHWTVETNGNGTLFLPGYIDHFKTHYPNRKFNNALEWCAGPGFIGFGILASDICDKLSLLEMYKPACELLDKTIEVSNLDNATVICADNVGVLTDKYDLIVGNPPHWRKYNSASRLMGANGREDKLNWIRIAVDTDWAIHREFFTNINRNMTEDCVILLLENTSEILSITQVANECGFALKEAHPVQSSVPNPNLPLGVEHAILEFVTL